MELNKYLQNDLHKFAQLIGRYRVIVKKYPGRSYVSGLRLVQAGMAGHFKSAPASINSDSRLLDKRQLRRLMRSEKRQGVIHRKAVRWSIPRWQLGPAYG